MNCFSLFPHLIYLPGYILDKKEMVQIFEQKGEKQYTGTKMEAFQLFLRIKGAIIACILSMKYSLLTFLLLTYSFGIIFSWITLAEMFEI